MRAFCKYLLFSENASFGEGRGEERRERRLGERRLGERRRERGGREGGKELVQCPLGASQSHHVKGCGRGGCLVLQSSLHYLPIAVPHIRYHNSSGGVRPELGW